MFFQSTLNDIAPSKASILVEMDALFFEYFAIVKMRVV